AGHSSSYSLYYGFGEGPNGGGSYNVTNLSGTTIANEGVITSPLIDLRGATAAPMLSFNYLIQTEPLTNYDRATVELSTNNGASSNLVAGNCPGGVLFTNDTSGQWRSLSVNLSNYVGSQVLLRFHFNTVDFGANNYEGWYIDDVTITGDLSGTRFAVFPTNSA